METVQLKTDLKVQYKLETGLSVYQTDEYGWDITYLYTVEYVRWLEERLGY